MNPGMPVPEGYDRRPVPMNEGLANDIGMHHTLPSAVADLVDNSIDAGAELVRVRLLLDGERPVGLQVVDDGGGMDAGAMDRAMTYAGRRDYEQGDLGHFGVGLKAASLSQADTLLVVSRAVGNPVVGRRLDRQTGSRAPELSVLSVTDAEARFAAVLPGLVYEPGTLVEWRNVRSFPAGDDENEWRRWLTTTLRSLKLHLGLVFHRLLADERFALRIETLDITGGAAGAPVDVVPRDPFGYPRSPVAGYPQDLDVHLDDGPTPVRIRAHLWPARSRDADYLLDRPSADELQGFYVYRNDRLLQVGGWSDVRTPRPQWATARLEVHLLANAERAVTINPEKSGVTFHPSLSRAVEKALGAVNGDTFVDYLRRAEALDRESRSRTAHPVTVVRPGVGLSDAVLAGYGQAVEFDDATPTIDIRWRVLPPDQVFGIDRDEHVLVLNARHRAALVGPEESGLNDAPVLKTLMHLLLNSYFEGDHLGPREKREITAWQAILLTAIQDQKDGMKP